MKEDKRVGLTKSFFLLLIAIVAIVCIAFIAFIIVSVSMLFKYGRDALAAYFYRLALSLDQLGNAVFNGNPDQTISGRLGIDLINNRFGCCEWKLKFCKVLDWAFSEKNHCVNSIDYDEIKKDVK